MVDSGYADSEMFCQFLLDSVSIGRVPHFRELHTFFSVGGEKVVFVGRDLDHLHF